MPEVESLSIEETNKLRISLGLKPLTVTNDDAAPAQQQQPDKDDSSFEAQEKRAVANWTKHQEELKKKEKRERQKEEIQKAKDAMKRFKPLEGKSLGEADGADEEDAAVWVRKMKKRQRKIAHKMAEELAAREQDGNGDYTAEQLAGVKVGHDFGDLEEGGETILTLKDATIDELEEEGDELENVQLNEKLRLKEKLELKKKKPIYDIYADDVDEDGNKRLLAQYDDEIDPKKKKKAFVLTGSSSAITGEARQKQVAEKLKQKLVTISLDAPEQETVSDYADPSTLKIKKLKKKSRSSRRKAATEDDDTLAGPSAINIDPGAMELDEAPAPKSTKRSAEDLNFVDDEELQASLALQRRAALKKRKLFKPEDLARQLREQSVPGPDGNETPDLEEDGEEPGIVLDETTEFVAGLRAPTISDRRRQRSVSKPAAVTAMADDEEGSSAPDPNADVDGDVNMDKDNEQYDSDSSEGRATLRERIKREVSVPSDITSTGLNSEATLTRGIGATLAMLSQRGLISRTSTSQAGNLNDLERDRERFRTEKKMRQLEAEQRAKLQREQDRKSGIFDKMSAREREEHARWENKQRDQQEAKEMAARFKDYKPNVQLSYKDEFGRDMSQKEAFKYLSHQFHGKGSGKAKTEKRLKKIEDEKKREAMSTLQSAAEGLTSSMADKAKKNKQAGVRLM